MQIRPFRTNDISKTFSVHRCTYGISRCPKDVCERERPKRKAQMPNSEMRKLTVEGKPSAERKIAAIRQSPQVASDWSEFWSWRWNKNSQIQRKCRNTLAYNYLIYDFLICPSNYNFLRCCPLLKRESHYMCYRLTCLRCPAMFADALILQDSLDTTSVITAILSLRLFTIF